ncbi:hypothetical protein [Nostoc sp.]|uniref:hypothetical protein n=1 Tax=Nostoc sp. TaxID=1180 RepID=UPI002FFCBC6E
MVHQSMKNVAQNMRRTGMLLFRDAFMEACHGEKLLCVVHAAHAAEILLKARIAQEHPLLMFSKLPTPLKDSKDTLGLIELLERGRSLTYEELPNQLWATTGIKIEPKRLEQYKEFGTIRNQIIHLSMLNTKKTPDELTLLYSLEILDPLIESFWGRSVFDFIKNDHFCDGNNFLSTGLLEETIKKILPIDERLRRLLGEGSRENLEMLETLNNLPIIYEPDESKNPTLEDYLKHEQENPQDSYPYASESELMEHWENFLNSF